MKNKLKKSVFLLSSLMMLTVGAGVVGGISENPVEVAEAADTKTTSISFASTDQRTEFSTGSQTWENEGVTFINEKTSSSSNVADYSNPVRLYQGSKVTIIAPGNITKIVFTVSASTYVSPLKESITNYKISAEGNNITAESTSHDVTFVIDALSAQVRLSSVAVTYEAGPIGEEHELEQIKTTSSLGFSYEKSSVEKEIKETKTYTFSGYTSGEQYAANEEHILDDIVTVYTTEAYFTNELRLYSSSTHDAFAIFKSSEKITSFGFNAGYNADTLNVYGSNDGKEYVLIQGVKVTSSYNDYTVDFGKNSYYYIKLDVAGTQQIRVKNVTMSISGDAVVDSYEFSDVRIRFRADIPAETYAKYSIISAGFVVYAEGYEDPMTVDCTGKFAQDKETGNYFIICSIWNIPAEAYNIVLTANAYFEVEDDDTYSAKTTKYSVATIADTYTKSDKYKVLTDEAKGAITAFNAQLA